MKTLDEVIDAIGFCKSGDLSKCKDCPYIGTCELDYAVLSDDALHYLKVLKDILDPLKVKKISHEITCPKCNSVIAILLPESNDPLGWETLKTMEGKPVWVERPEWKEWLLISEIDEGKCEMYLRDKWGNGVIVNGRNIGYWQAYRKERK